MMYPYVRSHVQSKKVKITETAAAFLISNLVYIFVSCHVLLV